MLLIGYCYQNQWSQNTPFKINLKKPFIIINLSAIVIKISGPKTLHLKSVKNKPFIIINFSAIVIKISGPKTLHLKSIKNKPFIIINRSVTVIKLQIIPVHI
jgi:hypothetical protein